MRVTSLSVEIQTFRSLLDILWRETCLEKKIAFIITTASSKQRQSRQLHGKETAPCRKLHRLSSAPTSPTSGSYLASGTLTCQSMRSGALRALLLLFLLLNPLGTEGTDARTPGFPHTLLEVPLSSLFSLCFRPICKSKHKTVSFFC